MQHNYALDSLIDQLTMYVTWTDNETVVSPGCIGVAPVTSDTAVSLYIGCTFPISLTEAVCTPTILISRLEASSSALDRASATAA